MTLRIETETIRILFNIEVQQQAERVIHRR